MAITVEQLNRAFSYDPETGVLTWNFRERSDFNSEWSWRVWNRKNAGNPAGSLCRGYITMRVYGARVTGHRVAMAIHTGTMPSIVDHINGDRSDNRISNLREVSASENARNMGKSESGRTKHFGVYWRPKVRSYQVRIRVDGRARNIGHFKHLHEAIAMRKCAEIRHGYHENHGRRTSRAS